MKIWRTSPSPTTLNSLRFHFRCTRMIFVFGPARDSFYVKNGKKSYWNNLPPTLDRLLRTEPSCSVEKVEGLELFPNGGYFLSCSNGKWASENVPPHISKIIAQKGPENCTGVEFDAYSPQTYMIATTERVICNGIPQDMLEAAFEFNFLGGTRMMALGCHGTWIIQPHVGPIRFNVRSAWLREQLTEGKHIKSLTLSPYNDQFAFIEFEGGNAAYMVPESWRPAIDNVCPHHSKISTFFRRQLESQQFQQFAGEQANNAASSITTSVLQSAFH